MACALRLRGEANPDDLARGHLSGQLSIVGDFDDSLRELIFDANEDYTNVEAHVLGPYGWAI